MNAIDEGIGHFKKYKYLLDDDNNMYYLGYIQAIEDGNTDRKLFETSSTPKIKKCMKKRRMNFALGLSSWQKI